MKNEKIQEIGGYFELDQYSHPMLYEDAILINCGRNALAYIIEARKIDKIWLPFFLCDSVSATCKKYNVEISYYHISNQFYPLNLDNVGNNEWVYIVNFYGQISDKKMLEMIATYRNIIIDNSQAYFQKPIKGVDTLYTCRKFFGVSDGAVLYTDKRLQRDLSYDESYERIHFVLGRYEKEASQFYEESAKNNDLFADEPIKIMSKLTYNLLHGINYDEVKRKRTDNFYYLQERFEMINNLKIEQVEGGFMYPLMIDNAQIIKEKLLQMKIYIPTLWPNVVKELPHDWLEWKLANNILPLPCDQRYGIEEMEIIYNTIAECGI